MNAEYCPFCGGALQLGTLTNSWKCPACIVTFPVMEFERYRLGILPEEFQMEDPDSIRLNDTRPGGMMISLFVSLLLLLYLLASRNPVCALFLFLTGCFFLRSIRQIEIVRRNGQLFLFSGVGNLGFRKTIPYSELLFAAARTEIGRNVVMAKVVFELRNGKNYVIAGGTTPLRALYLADWINGRTFFKEEPDTDAGHG